MFVELTHTSEDGNGQSYRLGDAYTVNVGDRSMGQIFRDLLAEYGRCTGKVYIDRWDGSAPAIGWHFEKREAYADSPKETYLKETWATVLAAKDTLMRIGHTVNIETGLELPHSPKIAAFLTPALCTTDKEAPNAA